MKTRTRRQFTTEFKTNLVLQVLRQEQTLNQIASANDVHPKQLQTAPAARLETNLSDGCAESLRGTKGGEKGRFG